MAVNPMAGTASTMPATRPFTRSCASSLPTSDQLHELELASLRLIEADLAVEDVAELREVAGAAGALVVDVLALREELQAFDGVVDLDAAALRDLPHVVADGRAGRLALGVGDGQEHEADVVVALAGVRVEVVGAEHLGQAPVAGRLDGGRPRRRGGAARGLGRPAAAQAGGDGGP